MVVHFAMSSGQPALLLDSCHQDPALERRFQPVYVPEPTVDETYEILQVRVTTGQRA